MKNVTSNRWARAVLISALVLMVLLAGAVLSALAITWGEPDTEHENVGAFMVKLDDDRVVPLCSGTLIHQRLFLTAAHCTARADELMAEGRVTAVYVNFSFTLADTANLPAVEVLTHIEYADFADPSNPHDVGILVLEDAVEGIAPANLPYEGFLDELKRDGLLRTGTSQQKGWADRNGAKFTVVGYGGVLAWPPPDITYEDERRSAESEYVALVPAQLHMDQNRLHENGGTCFGDSGGPAFWEPDEATSILVGITSWGDAQCVVTGFDYRVDIADTLDFIEDTIATLD